MRTKFRVIFTLILAFIVQLTFAQQKTVTGKVVDGDGLPIPGVNVIIKGTTTGTQTDFDGVFTIQASSTDVLVFIYTGMKKIERTIGQNTSINVTLTSDLEALDEVVIMGYGGESRSEISSATSILGPEEINNVALPNVSQILQGRAAGVRVSSGSGQPGADPNVIIRGVNSIAGSGQQPLYIIDGVPVESGVFSTLNPNDIESLNVLKDAAAQSIYGSRGAAGVIIITTKKGKAGKTVVNYSTQVGFSEIGVRQFDMMTSRELLEFQRTVNRSVGAGLTDQEIAEIAQTNTDWEDVFFRTGYTTTHDLSISGGNEKTQFRTSLGYFSQQGIAERSQLDRYSGSFNLSHQVSDKFRIQSSLIASFSRSNFIDSEGGIFLQNPFAAVYLAAPYDSLRNEDGSFNSGPNLVGGNAYEQLVTGGNQTERIRATYNINAEYDITSYLRARVSGSVDFRESINVDFTDPNSEFGQTTNPGNAGSFSPSYSRGAVLSGVTSLEYHKVFNEKHDFSATLFYEFISDRTESPFNFNFRVFGLNENVPPSIAAATISADLLPTINGANGTPVNLRSYFTKIVYGYDDRYIFNFTLRSDESSKFSENNRQAVFGSASFAWNLHNESFLEQNAFIDNLKLRLSYGTVGNQGAIGTFQSRTIFGSGQYNGNITLFPQTPGNPDLKWETVTTFNAGVDFGLFKNRINGAIDVYHSTTSDLFVNQQLSASSGFATQDINAGEMVNKGIEIELRGTLVRSSNVGGFQWDIFGNIAYNDNEITDLGQVDEFEQGTSILREGLPFGTHYIVGWAGVNPANGEPLYLDADGNVTNVFSDDNRRTDYGTYVSPFTGGFGTEISFKGFYLNTLFSFERDFSRFNNQTFFQENPNFAQFNQLRIMNTMWQNPGDVTEVQSFLFPRQFSSKDIEDASYLRLRQVELGYNFPQSLLDKTFITGIRAYVQAINLYTWTNWTGFDPEDSNNIASYEYPTPRTITFGLNLTF